MSPEAFPLEAVCRLPAPGDNVAIAIRRLDAGTCIAFADGVQSLAHTVLEGHRFAIRPIAAGEPLLSWALPFGTALGAIAAGEYVCNASMLAALAVRSLDANVVLPAQPNFADRLQAFAFDATTFRPGTPTPPAAALRTFLGYRRPGKRGVGTRNVIVVVGTTSQTASFARQLVARLQPLARVHPALDGIVAIAHTEGAGPGEPNNAAEVLRALAGFLVHPNVGAVLAVDYGTEPVTNARLAAYMHERSYPLADVPHRFLSLTGGVAAGLAEGEAIIRAWAPQVASQPRTAEPLSGLKIALQCGGSDAFSGVSGNPLAGAIAHEVIRHGGTAVLTETDEAVGGEDYLMRNIRDAATARALLAKIDSFRERLSWHGVTAEGNPSAGNKFRGLYNITLKSLGAVHKKDPRTRIEFVCEYADPLREPGFYFMNGPGNDLEGVAGQIAAGCNLVLFVTGNGSITNFPFVPTLKITTTTRRHELLIREMDINAGRYLDGESMEKLAAESVDTVIATASGARTKGEHAGHSQVSLWRNWRQTDASHVAELKARPDPDGRPLALSDVAGVSSTRAESMPDVGRGGRTPPALMGAGGDGDRPDRHSEVERDVPVALSDTAQPKRDEDIALHPASSGAGAVNCRAPVSQAPASATQPPSEAPTAHPASPTGAAAGDRVATSVSEWRSVASDVSLHVFPTDSGFATERVALVLPTSLCSAQIARLAAERLNAKQLGRAHGIARFVALPHTEGCGFSGESMYQLLYRTYRGYLTHPNVVTALLLEHGCEKVTNDAMRRQLERAGIPLTRFGWASVQLDGGIGKVLDKVEAWFVDRFAALPAAREATGGLGALNLALVTAAPVADSTATALGAIARSVVCGGGSVLVPESDRLLANPAFVTALAFPHSEVERDVPVALSEAGQTKRDGDIALHPASSGAGAVNWRAPVLQAPASASQTPCVESTDRHGIHATLLYGQPIVHRGFHVVRTETDHWVENITGLTGSGAHVALTVVSGHAEQGHPLIPVIQAAEPRDRGRVPGDDIDLFLTGDVEADGRALLATLAAVVNRQRTPAANVQGFVDFQLTRGLLGVTT